MSHIRKFTYTKESGATSIREVWVLDNTDEHLFGIDLSQFDEEERNYYRGLLIEIEETIKAEIAEAGLETCYRKFLKERIAP